MRAYFFGNMYLSSIQQGIQAGHVIGELFVSYPESSILRTGDMSSEGKLLWEWACDHKTMILLNGGYSENIHRLCEFFDVYQNTYPWAYFNESKDALDGALTCVGIVLPEKIYETAKLLREGGIDNTFLDHVVFNPNNPEEEWTFSKWEMKLMDELNKHGMAQ